MTHESPIGVMFNRQAGSVLLMEISKSCVFNSTGVVMDRKAFDLGRQPLAARHVALAAVLAMAATNASASVTCSFGDVLGGSSSNTTLAGTMDVGTDPSSFLIGANFGTALSNALDCYSFTTTTAFQIDGYINQFQNLSSGGTYLKNSGGTYYNLNPFFATNGSTVPLGWSDTFGAGSYALLVYMNPTKFTGDPDTYSGQAFLRAVPEPQTYAMLLAGLGVIGFVGRRRKKTL